MCCWLGCWSPSVKLLVSMVVDLLVHLGSWRGLPVGFVYLELWFPPGGLGLVSQLAVLLIP